MGVGEGVRAAVAMVVVQMAFAGVNIFYKLAIVDGMNMRILLAYRNLFSAAVLCPLAYLWERKTRPKMTWRILLQGFLCGLFGLTISQNLYIVIIKITSATFASAMANLVPAFTYILAVLFRLESFGICKVSGCAKLVGTLIGIGGAMVLTFYKGAEIDLWSTNINLLKQHEGSTHTASQPHIESRNRVIGSLLALGSCLSYSTWLIIQTKMSKVYPCHYSCTSLMSLTASIQCTVLALCLERKWDQWNLGLNIRLLTVTYSGIVASGLVLVVLSWCIKKKGPLYVSVFNPLMLVIVALLSSLLLNEQLQVGSVIGAVLIVIGLYLTLWGKRREMSTSVSGIYDSSNGSSLPELQDPSHLESKEAKSEVDLENQVAGNRI